MTYKLDYIAGHDTSGTSRFFGHRLALLLLSLIMALLPIMAILHLPTTGLVSANPLTRLDPQLQTTLAAAAPDARIRVIIYLDSETTLSAVTLSGSELNRRTQIIGHLQQTAVSAQTSLQTHLQTLQKSGAVTAVRSFWIINAVAATATPLAIEQLAAQPNVSRVVLDEQHAYFAPPESAFDPDALFGTTAVFTSPIRSWGINRIHAPQVWHGLGIDGTGVTVAIMDTGVDWQHPDLLPNYRGNQGSTPDHSASWYYTLDPSVDAPIDLYGHGTHVAGTAVGQNGIGVAPGATWIAVGLTDETGLIFDSDIHAGFEWLLAPGGNPALAPDVVNNSWGASGTRTVFYDDIEILQAAGIVTVFSAGNSGPWPGSIGVPAAYTNTIAVGAGDELDLVAWFSSRGPSLLTKEQHPHLVAPGTDIFSSYPDNQYAYLNGTSMASPHVVGTIALLLSANPSLNRTQLLNRLQETAVPIDPPHPNNDTGWGLVDAYAAVSAYVTTGTLQGIVRHDGTPQAGIVVTITNSSGHAIPFVTDAAGKYMAALIPGSYTVSTAPFGFDPLSFANQTVTVKNTTIRNFNLTRQPFGTIQGTVRHAETNAPLADVTIEANGLPVTAVTDANGRYTIELPISQVKLVAAQAGYRLRRAIVLPQVGQTQTINFNLPPARRILVVDSGQWVYHSQAAYFQNSLTSLNYSFDTWSIRNPFTDIPTHLPTYDVVIWSDPYYSPGYIGAGAVVSDFLKLGGNLLISGQNVGAYDGGIFSSQRWWDDQLNGEFLGKTAVTQTITGLPNTSFAQTTLSLNGGSSANNQTAADVSRPRHNSVTEPILQYENGTGAGLQSGRCRPYDIVYFGFGLEGVTDSIDRAALIQNSFAYFDQPEAATGVRWESSDIDAFTLKGEQLVYTLTLRNLSELYTDTFHIDLSAHGWPVTVISPTVTMGPCGVSKTAVSIQVPPNAPADTENVTQITAVSAIDANTTDSLTLYHKTPGHILLVDDHRWYDQTALYQNLLDNLGLTYDTWTTGNNPPPSASFLQAYDLIFWYTAYDWFAPITAAERANLQAFLDSGGRLFLTSQDFLFYHHQTPLAHDYFGVLDYQEGITPTVAYGGASPGLSPDLAGPLPLSYDPYQNYSDGIIPTSDTAVLFWSDAGLPAAIYRRTDDFRTILMSIPFETISETAQAAAMNQVAGWLGDLGDSTVLADQTVGSVGEMRTFTITARNDSQGYTNNATVTDVLPEALQIDAGSITGGAVYQAA
ncbi:MAG: S8 family serine peptidase, partial [Anaerolineales bacterium]|nr:S8 family serine peptidase [Anaerolineales bacterium]